MRRTSTNTRRSALVLALLAVAAAALPLSCSRARPRGPEPVMVFAAASLSPVLRRVANVWTAQGHSAVSIQFGATSRLARQVESGAQADLVFTADAAWMDDLASHNQIARETRVDLVSNRIVVVVPSEGTFRPTNPTELVAPALHHFALAGEDVPAGRYARAALASAGVLGALQGRIVNTESVRGALAAVARSEAEAGVVYATDALFEPHLRVMFTFPEASHPRIVYPAAVTRTAAHSAEARRFLAFCQSAIAQDLFRSAGFIPLAEHAP